jgi:hypothetical protein
MTPLHAGVTRPDPLVITLDGHDYVTWVSPVVFSPGTRLLLAPESSMSNCRRGDSQILPPGLFQLLHTPAGGKIDSIAMRIEFRPTRIIFDTEFGDVICDGEAPGHVTGVGRVFRDEFEPELPLTR